MTVGAWKETSGTFGTPGTIPATPGSVELIVSITSGTIAGSWAAAARATSYRAEIYTEGTPLSGTYNTLELSETTTGLGAEWNTAEIEAAGGPWSRLQLKVFGVNASGDSAAGTATFTGGDLSETTPPIRATAFDVVNAATSTRARLTTEGDGDTILSVSPDGTAFFTAFTIDRATGVIQVGTPWPITSGGTGASTAADARTNLGLGTMATQNASAVAIAGGAVNATTVGLTSAAAANFTTVGVSGSLTMALLNINFSTVARGIFFSEGGAIYDTAVATVVLAAQDIFQVRPEDNSPPILDVRSSGIFTFLGNYVYRAGGTDVPVADGGTGASDAGTARTNLGVAIGSNVQAYHANLAAFAGLTLVADRLPYANGAGTLALATFTAFGRSLADDADAAAGRATLALGALATLATVATAQIDADAVTYAKIQNVSATDRVLGRSTAGAGDVEEITFTAVARALADDVDAAAMQSTLGLGSMAVQNSAAVAITGGNAVLSTLTLANGGRLFDEPGIGTVITANEDSFRIYKEDFSTPILDVTDSGTFAFKGDYVYRADGTDVALADGGTGSSTAAGARTTLGVVIGTDVQAFHANLTAFSGLSLVADRLPYADGAGTLALATFTAFGRSLVDDADAVAGRTTLALGALATLATVGTAQVDNDAITYAKIQNVSATDKVLGRLTAGAGDMEEITFTAVARALADDVDAAAMRVTLGAEIGVNVQAYDADLAALAANATDGLWARTAAGSGAARAITGTAAEITVTNGSGVAGDPTLSLPAALTFTGKTVTGGTFSAPTISGGTINNATVGATTALTGRFTTVNSTSNVYYLNGVAALVVSASGHAIRGPDGVRNAFLNITNLNLYQETTHRFLQQAGGGTTFAEIDLNGMRTTANEVRVGGDKGGQASHNTLTGVSNLTANSTGVGSILFKGATSRDSSGFLKVYIGTTAYYVPVFSGISG